MTTRSSDREPSIGRQLLAGSTVGTKADKGVGRQQLENPTATPKAATKGMGTGVRITLAFGGALVALPVIGSFIPPKTHEKIRADRVNIEIHKGCIEFRHGDGVWAFKMADDHRADMKAICDKAGY